MIKLGMIIMIGKMLSLWRFVGVIAIALAWIIIAISSALNPWFSISKHALSDLGGPKAENPWIYNYGLIVVGVLTCTYSLYLGYKAKEIAHIYASAFIFIAGIFLALIGVFPSSTRPHTFVSTWFFVQMWMAMMASAIGFVRSEKALGTALLTLTIVAPLVASLVEASIGWPSVAILEIYGIIILDIYVITLTLRF